MYLSSTNVDIMAENMPDLYFNHKIIYVQFYFTPVYAAAAAENCERRDADDAAADH